MNTVTTIILSKIDILGKKIDNIRFDDPSIDIKKDIQNLQKTLDIHTLLYNKIIETM